MSGRVVDTAFATDYDLARRSVEELRALDQWAHDHWLAGHSVTGQFDTLSQRLVLRAYEGLPHTPSPGERAFRTFAQWLGR